MFNFSQLSGNSGTTQITISATSREELTDLTKFYTLANVVTEVNMPVSQRAYEPLEKYINFQPSAITWSNSGGTANLTVQSNDEWYIVADGWIQLTRLSDMTEEPQTLSGNGNSVIGIRCYENVGSARTGGISGYCVSNSAISATTTVQQSGGYEAPYLYLSQYQYPVEASGYTGCSVSVYSNLDWTTISDARWIVVNTVSGSNNGTLLFDVQHSEQIVNRIGTITISSTTENLSVDLNVLQSATTLDPYLVVTPSISTIQSSGGELTLSVSSNTTWETSVQYSGDSVSWISLSDLNGDGDMDVTVRVDGYGVSNRNATIKFFNEHYGLESNCSIYQLKDNTKIYYTTTDGEIVTNVSVNGFGANLVSNTYSDGIGILSFDGPVTRIGSSGQVGSVHPAFNHSTTLLSIEIPDTVTYIGFGAFLGCSSLSSITIPSNVETVDIYAFENCTGLRTVYWNTSKVGSVDRLWTGAYSAVTDVIIGEGVTAIPQYLCQNLKNPINVVFPTTLTTIPKYAFDDSGIEVLILPSNIEVIEMNAFRRCTSLNTVYSYSMTEPDTQGIGASFLPTTNNGTLHYPIGGNYYVWTHTLPSGWTAIADL